VLLTAVATLEPVRLLTQIILSAAYRHPRRRGVKIVLTSSKNTRWPAMKFKNYLESISGVSIYPIITLLIFFFVFAVLFIWVFHARNKSRMVEASELPLFAGEVDAIPDPARIA
jgi:cytochrome c oxidase cbb3-type subunit 4